MIKFNYLANVTLLAAPLLARAVDPRTLPIIACYSQEAVKRDIGFAVFWDADKLGIPDDLSAADSSCAELGATAQRRLGEIDIDAARGTKGELAVFPFIGPRSGSAADQDLEGTKAGVDQSCLITIKDWPSKETPYLYLHDFKEVNPTVEDFGPRNGAGEGLFEIQCKEFV